jgi:ZIP family zinc transporter
MVREATQLDEVTRIIVYTVCAGACIPLGGLLAKHEKLRPSWLENEFRHSVIAFGGGILAAAVALVLIPEGNAYLGQSSSGTFYFLCGGILFFALERFLGLRRREKPQFTAMLLDYIPESLALGGALAAGSRAAPLLALFIGLQNIPEGFNAYRELKAAKQMAESRVLMLMLMLVPIGPVIALLGWMYLGDRVALLGATMLFASGGIMYLIFQDIAPQSHMRRHWAPPLGAILGFSVGMLGNNLAGIY